MLTRISSVFISSLLLAQAAAGITLEKIASLAPPFTHFAPQTPAALAISPTDRVYYLDARLAVVVELTPEGKAIRQIGGPGSGLEQFSDPSDLCAVSGLDIFIADRGNDRIVRLDRDLTYLAEFRSLAGTPFDLTFENPKSVLLGPRGDLFIADGGNDRILKIDPTGQPAFSFGEYGATSGALQTLCRLESDPRGGLWALDLDGRVTRFDEYGGFLRQLEAQIAGNPTGLAVSPDRVWVCSDSLLWVFARESRQVDTFTPGELDVPRSSTFIDVALRRGRLWLLDASGTIHRYKVSTAR